MPQVDRAEVEHADQAATRAAEPADTPSRRPGPRRHARAAAARAGERGYTIDEIREITRGFFGTISTEPRQRLEYAFSTSGRPDGYVLGTEGGGAFLAGVRYGSGTLYLRSGGTGEGLLARAVDRHRLRRLGLAHHVPDLQSARARASSIREFTGIDGSAYFVGGVGITFLKGGHGASWRRSAPGSASASAPTSATSASRRAPTWNPF